MDAHENYNNTKTLKTAMLSYVHPSYLDVPPQNVQPNILSWNERYVGPDEYECFAILGVAIFLDGKNFYGGFRVEVNSPLEKEKAMKDLHRLFHKWSVTQTDDNSSWFVPRPDYV